MDAVLFGNGIGNFIMATPFFQCLEDPEIFIPETDDRRQAIESISCWPVHPFRDVSQLEGYRRIYRLWCAPKVETENMIIQDKPPLGDWPESLHESEAYLHLIPEKPPKEIPPPKIKSEGGWKFFRTENQIIIGLGNGSNPSWDKKKWPADRWAELIQKLLSMNGNYQFAFFGGKAEAKQGRELEKRFQNKLWNFAGRLSLAASANTLKQCSFLITTDSGLMHVAGALNIPIVTLWGPTHWAKNRPLSKAPVYKVSPPPGICPLYPCYGKPEMWHCKKAVCMESITVEQIIKEITKGR